MTTIYKRTVVFALLLLVCVGLLWFYPITAYAEEAGYSSVLKDLENDPNFDVGLYPANEKDYSLQVVQIAESTAGELLVYVYQPSNGTKDYTASSINISTAINDSLKYLNYKLQLLSREGYDLKIVPEVSDELDFQFKLNDELVWFSSDQSDYTELFDIKKEEKSFTIDFSTCKIADLLTRKYSEYQVSDVPNPQSGSYFTLVVIDKSNSSNQVRIALNNILEVAVEGVDLKGEIRL